MKLNDMQGISTAPRGCSYHEQQCFPAAILPPPRPILKSHFSQLKYGGFRKKLTTHINYTGCKYINLLVFSSLMYYQISHMVKKTMKADKHHLITHSA